MTLHATCDCCGSGGLVATRAPGVAHGYVFDGPDCEVAISLIRRNSVPPMPYGDLCFPCLQALVQETMAGTKKNGPRAISR
jgi:hypothetical protein